jgi:hypothetical protein
MQAKPCTLQQALNIKNLLTGLTKFYRPLKNILFRCGGGGVGGGGGHPCTLLLLVTLLLSPPVKQEFQLLPYIVQMPHKLGRSGHARECPPCMLDKRHHWGKHAVLCELHIIVAVGVSRVK